MGKFKMMAILFSMSFLASCGLIESNKTTQSSQSSNVESNNTQSAEVPTAESSESDSDQSLAEFSDEEIEYARVWLNEGKNMDVSNLKVTSIPKGSLINPDNVNYGTYDEDIIEIQGPQETDGHVVYSVRDKGSGYIHIYPIPYIFDHAESQEFSKYENIEENTEAVYLEPGDSQIVSQLINVIDISKKESFMSMDTAIEIYEEGLKATSNGETSGLNSEFYSRDYFAIEQDEPDSLMLSFENQGRGGKDYYFFKGEDDTIKIDTYFESYEKDEPDIQWTYDIYTQTFTEELSQEREDQQKVIEPFTEETAFEFIKEQEGFNDDITVQVSKTRDDGSIEITLASKELQENGGSGTVDTFIIYPNGNYYSEHE
ncbi:hypothetical protein [Aerococcus urinaeequi]